MKNETVWELPCVGIYHSGEFAVLFSGFSKNKSMAMGEVVRSNGLHPVGYYSMHWVLGAFHPEADIDANKDTVKDTVELHTIESLLEMLKPVIDHGLEVKVSRWDNNWHVDLDTQAKSSCVVTVMEGQLLAKRRYDRLDPVKSLADVVMLIEDCKHGRDYLNPVWESFIQNFYG